MNGPNALQKIYRELKKGMEPLYTELSESIGSNIGEFTPAASIDISFKETDFLNKAMAEINAAQVASSASAFKGTDIVLKEDKASDYFQNTKFSDGVSLSDTMKAGEYQKAAKIVVKDAVKQNKIVSDVTKSIEKAVAAGNKEKAITGIEQLIKSFKSSDAQQAQKDLKKLKARINQLKEGQLKKSYEKVASAVEKGKKEAIEKAVDKAVNQQAKYITERISRTEIARAYDMSVSRAIDDEPDAIGYIWVLSPQHPRPDICDFYAEVDAYGMGPGVYPANAGASIPAHPNCLCSKEIYYRDPLADGNQVGRFSKERVNEYLSGIDDKKRGQIIGVENAKSKSTYQAGLEKKGFAPNDTSIKMISQSIIERKAD